ncbi:hypothetical protein [Nocardiopsis sp. JB363]|uniref:hypothetical protein n=1 Tax=Nocardiopsis sp. JB363 TaxID=1434837 RepID=UPI000979DD71|nr:hypothetical protein [Nocardiopsis sp. JB363]SIO89646.1 hypothetical protein BQ8420_22655 [Nocardiopsis sp. JB363]
MTTTAVREDTTITFPFGTKVTGTLIHDAEHSRLVLETDEGPEPLSINLANDGLLPAEGCVFIKDWSDRAGLAESLEQQGLVEIVGRRVVGPFSSTAYEVRVLLD